MFGRSTQIALGTRVIKDERELQMLLNIITADPKSLLDVPRRRKGIKIVSVGAYVAIQYGLPGTRDQGLIAAIGDTVVLYANDRFSIVPTGTPGGMRHQRYSARQAALIAA